MPFLSRYEHWKSLTSKRTGEFLAAGTIMGRFGGLKVMKNVLGLDETPPALKGSFKTATKLRHELPTDVEMESIPLGELSSLVEDIHVKTRETYHKILTLTCESFLGLIRPFKAYGVNS